MNSLRTDDILGAKPRVRHMPKNLIRQRKIPTYFMTNLQQTNPEVGQYNDRSYTKKQLDFNPIQYQNNDPTAYPFVARHILTKEPKYVNYDYSKQDNYRNREPAEQLRRQMSRVASQNKYYQVQKPEIIEKQYNRRVDSGRRQNQARRLSQSMNFETKSNKSQEQASQKRSDASSRRSVENYRQQRNEQREEGKQIFRGLGFNIISNHKFQYTFEHKLPSRF